MEERSVAGPKSGIDAIIFDLGRVLIRVDTERGMFRHITQRLGGGGEERMKRLIDQDLFREFATGRLDPHGMHKALTAKLGIEMGFDEFRRLWCDVFDEMPGMKALVTEIAASDAVSLGMLSDTDPVHWEYISGRFDVTAHFQNPTLSYETGLMKPDEGAYLAAAKAVGAETGKCLFVDDLERNVEGAMAAGMQAVQFAGACALRKELVERGVLCD